MRNTSPAKVSTYAYVNPVIAVYLGWAFANEPITPQILIASLLLVTAVVIVLRFGTVKSLETGDGRREIKRRKVRLWWPGVGARRV